MNPKLKALQLKARHQVYTLLSGHNLSRLYGEGYDFAELREYQIGDDIRKINWTITAKLGKPYIKELHANRELFVSVASLLDGSVYFGEGNAKQHLHTEVAALLGFATLHGNDLFSGICYTPHDTYTTVATKQPFEIERFTEEIDTAALLHTALPLQEKIDDLFTRLHKPSLLFILHDFLEPVDLSVLAQRHEVIAVIIRDRREEMLQNEGEVEIENPLSGKRMKSTIGRHSIRHYRATLEAHESKLNAHFSRYGIRYVKIFTDEEPAEKLMRLFR
jgi:uncharacterized protein (DUF58 family)